MLATWGTSTGFNPASLFAGGVQGAWYDPSDNTTMFQDAAGTTPVTAVEQAVGLILDKSKGLVLGPELFSNQAGTFDNTSGGATATYTSATQTVSVTVAGTSTTYPRLTIDLGLTVGRTYLVSGRIDGTRTGVFGIRLATLGSANDLSYNNSTGVFQGRVVAGATSIQFLYDGTVTGSRNIALLSVRELPGNHAFQSTSASRPTLRARYNLLTYSEEFDNAAWTKTRVNVTQNAAAAPTGVTTADKLIATSVAGTHRVLASASKPSQAQRMTFSCYIKAAEYAFSMVRITDSTETDNASCAVNLSTGEILTAASGFTGVSGSATNVGNGWWLVAVTATTDAESSMNATVFIQTSLSTSGSSFTGNDSDGLLVWGAQLVPTAVFPSNVYQRIAAATDYATGAAFPQYLAFDGTDDSLLTSSVDFATVTSDGQARRNLLSNPNLFNVAGTSVGQWDNNANGSTLTANVEVAPDGTTTASLLQDNPSSGNSSWFLQTFSGTVGVTYTFSCYIKAAVGSVIQLWIYNNVTGGARNTITATGAWQRFTLTHTLPVGTTEARAGFDNAPVGGVYIWAAQLETGSTATAFQNIGTDKMTVFSGLSKLSDATGGMICEQSGGGAFYLYAPGTTDYQWRSGGTLNSNVNSTTFAAPITNVITGIGDISGDISTIRVNGTQSNTSSADQGTGNYANAALNIGRRNNSSLPFNGRIYSLIVRGAQSNSTQIAQTERYVASKTPLGVVP